MDILEVKNTLEQNNLIKIIKSNNHRLHIFQEHMERYLE
jgi:hypothetical protein